MAIIHHVIGYENFLEFVKKLETKDEIINIYFGGLKVDGISWCSDCVNAEPYIKKAIDKAPEKSHFIFVEVGDRAYWKDMKCPFRTDKNIHISVLPTIIRWKNPQRLEGEQCEKSVLLEMFMTEETD